MFIVTTSWDDGHVFDKRLVDLLDRYGLKGTFYVAHDRQAECLSGDDLKRISATHEIGAHTLTHPNLERLSVDEQRKEIVGSKEWIESAVNKEVRMFCYPAGHVGEESEAIVKQAGYIGARTTELGKINIENPFLMPTTVHVYPFPFRKKNAEAYYWRKLFQPLTERGRAYRDLGVGFGSFMSWKSLACASFDIAMKKNGIFHLWGHSWEIEKYGMWTELELIFQHISHRPDCLYLTNGEVIKSL